LAPACAAVQVFLVRPDCESPRPKLAETVNCWAAVSLLLTLSSIPVVMYVTGQSGDFWTRNAMRVVVAIAALHGGGLTIAMLSPRKRRFAVPEPLSSRAAQVITILLALSVAWIALFWIDPSDRTQSLFIRLFLVPPFSGEPGAFGLGGAVMLAVLAIAAIAALGKFEAALARRGPKPLQAARIAALCVAITAAVVRFFAFSVTSDVAHYMTNVGPVLHLLHGGALMVDTFSQYGPGPVLITLAGLRIGPATFGTAQITVQVFNLAFYALWLICLYRMTRWKLP